MIETAIVLCMGAVAVSMLLALWRLLRGPGAPDRILALDTFSINAIALLVLDGMYLKSEIYFEAALVIAMLGFVTTVVLCKYVLRRDIFE
jgi:multicomponent K+:H+ antiporter subunit F